MSNNATELGLGRVSDPAGTRPHGGKAKRYRARSAASVSSWPQALRGRERWQLCAKDGNILFEFAALP